MSYHDAFFRGSQEWQQNIEDENEMCRNRMKWRLNLSAVIPVHLCTWTWDFKVTELLLQNVFIIIFTITILFGLSTHCDAATAPC